MNISDRIQNLRKTRGISQEELADIIGVSRQAVSKWESEQSTPDLDKVIMLSDYFEVTTDYFLKGIEGGAATTEKTVNAKVFTIVATALNFIGLIVACAVWYERQISTAIVIGLVLMAIGSMVYGIGLQVSEENTKGSAKRLFWAVNIWPLCLIILSFFYNMVSSRIPAPYPLLNSYFHNPMLLLLLFWLLYFTICLGVGLIQIKKKSKHTM
ncbi:hypothetical protein SDC9_44334 [bioreactor metagenome]|uniref:HTH cro/C1-type domain-containing protein n=1 Tax=bioreactor metagenome TaxID=1076179 RepID=A0A644W3N1_9ZZZZ